MQTPVVFWAKITQGALDSFFIIPFNIIIDVFYGHLAAIVCKISVIKALVL